MQLLLADDAARPTMAALTRALEDGTLAVALQEPYDLSLDEATEVCALVDRTLVDVWGGSHPHLAFAQWLTGAPPALLHVLVDSAARAIHNPWTGGDDLHVLRYALGRIATDPALRD
ncbi:hypothetical protein [Kitasatospora purpeofusca]|uniref:hypothetical protein n=1 Tax=Kitasatospora purpeofusca TaxID=67352 RepID=UPI0037F53C3F